MSGGAIPAIRLDRVTLGYGRHRVLSDLDVSIAPGSLTAVVGPNGAGKSTLLKAIAGALAPVSGHIRRDGISQGRRAYLPQQAEIDRTFPLRLRDLVAMGLWAEIGAFGAVTRGQGARVDAALDTVGLGGLGGRSLAALSGGQVQRALFARLILQDAALMLLDEPFAAIDTRTMDHLLGLVHRWHDEGRTVLAVLHDLDTVRAAFPATLVLGAGLVAHGPTDKVLTPETLARARALTEAAQAGPQAEPRAAAA